MSTSAWIDLLPPENGAWPSDERLASGFAHLFWLAQRHEQPAMFVSEALPQIAHMLRAEFIALAVADQGRWQTQSQFGRARPLPFHFLSEVIDRGSAGRFAGEREVWFAAPLARRDPSGVLILAEPLAASAETAQQTLQLIAQAAPLFGCAVQSVQQRAAEKRRIERLEAVLSIAAKWSQAQETQPLLVQMAEAATRLLEADRASIFLWDKAAKQLVGRPALGLENDELRVPDNVGVVGRVLQTGQPERVREGLTPDLIARQVDQQTGYQTRNLICVPLNAPNGQRIGVFEVLNKKAGSFSDDDVAALTELAGHAAIALGNAQERESLLESRRTITETAAENIRLIGESAAIVALRSTVARVAATDLAVLILGENGTGKEVISQTVHYLSSRRNQPFIAVNCAAISENLLESELFGHEKGAFTDAHESRQGKFELASGGTLFLDEIGDMSLGGQSKLLRVLEEKVVVRVGGSKPIHTDARVIAATNQDLGAMVRQKKFRQDLFFRLNVVSLELPALRDRSDDILLLAEHFLDDFCRKARRKKPLKLTADARRRLMAHPWPGNVRELRNLMERLAYLSPDERIDADDLVFRSTPSSSDPIPAVTHVDLPLAEATDRFQTDYIKRAIQQMNGNMSDAARALGLHRSNLYRKMRQLRMDLGGNNHGEEE